MRVQGANFRELRGFSNLVIEDLPSNARLVVLAGPNGTGKSSVFDCFRVWQGRNDINWDQHYHVKMGAAPRQSGPSQADVTFHGTPAPINADDVHRAFYFRTAYRVEADFSSSSIVGATPTLPSLSGRIHRMSDTDTTVSSNYQFLLTRAVRELFDGDDRSTRSLREDLVGPIRRAMQRIFPNLDVENLSHPLEGGGFYFSKGTSRRWHYKNLSGGERAAFDLLLDLAVKREVYSDTVYCIDEPENHLNTRVQGPVLRELIDLLPPESQLWIATHSIGMMKEARNRQEKCGDVVFLDFESANFDQPTVLRPLNVDRSFWYRTLRVAVDDLADLVAPSQVVMVEGRPKWESGRSRNVEFDASCLRKIFDRQYPDTEFVSVGSSTNVEGDALHLSGYTSIIAPGASVLRVVDRDERSPEEVKLLNDDGIRVLRHRDLENYLLSDETLQALATEKGDLSAGSEAIARRDFLLQENAKNGSPDDDIKEISGQLYLWLKDRLNLHQVGNTSVAFLRDTMTQYVTPETRIYRELEEDIFGKSDTS
jgi:predicted ATPase